MKIDEWPISYERYIDRIDLIESNEFDQNIAEISLRLCIKFISEKSNFNEIEEKDQVAILKYLMTQLHYDSNKFLSSKEIKQHLKNLFEREYNNRYFMSLIAKLRDNDLLISSSSKGYKIPTSSNDIYSYTNHSISVIIPMIERLKKCRDRILTITDKKLDIINSPEFEKIRKLFK